MRIDRRVTSRDRRASPRVPVVCAVRYLRGAKAQLYLAANISRQGMELRRVRDAPLHPGRSLTLEFELPGTRRLIAATGEVVRDEDAAPAGITGIRFAAVAPEQWRVIDEFVGTAVPTQVRRRS